MSEDLQKYLWTMSGMRLTQNLGAMPYYRMADVEDLLRKLDQHVIGDLTAKLEYVIKMYHLVNPLEDGVFTFPDGDSWSLKPEDSA